MTIDTSFESAPLLLIYGFVATAFAAYLYVLTFDAVEMLERDGNHAV